MRQQAWTGGLLQHGRVCRMERWRVLLLLLQLLGSHVWRVSLSMRSLMEGHVVSAVCWCGSCRNR